MIVGSGIRSLVQMTPEATLSFKTADAVFIGASEEAWLKLSSIRSDSVDLRRFYMPGRSRQLIYENMCQAILKSVRRNQNVCAVFYGHPGFAVTASHRAIAIARSEGYRAEMLPGVSFLDCLCADLGVDLVEGLQVFEANHMLRNHQIPSVDLHTVISQLDVVGTHKFNSNSTSLRERKGKLVRYLLNFYEADQECALYEASDSLSRQFRVKRIRLANLASSANNGWMTAYISPPRI